MKIIAKTTLFFKSFVVQFIDTFKCFPNKIYRVQIIIPPTIELLYIYIYIYIYIYKLYLAIPLLIHVKLNFLPLDNYDLALN